MKTLFLKDINALIFDKKEKLLYFVLLLFFFSLYAPGISWLYNVCMYIFFVYSFFYNSISEKWVLLKQRKEIILILCFFLLNLISALLSKNFQEGIGMLGIRISLAFITFGIGTIFIKKFLKERIIFGFAFATTTAAIGILIYGLWRASKNGDLSLLYNDNLSNIINLQSIYFAMLINITIFSFIYLWINKSTLINKQVLIPLFFILFIVHFLLASRIAIIILYGSTFIFAFYHIFKRKLIVEGITLIVGLLIGMFLMLKFFPKTINRFKELTHTKFDYKSMGKESHFNMELTEDQWNGANLRIAVWECAWTVIKNNIIIGTGLGDKMDELKKQYAKKEFYFGIKTNRNLHNNYLDVWISLGLIGVIIFLLGFIVLPIFYCINSKDWYGLLIIISFMLSMISETYMDRTVGNTMLAFFVAFITSYKKRSENFYWLSFK